jgi:hypothetical protein
MQGAVLRDKWQKKACFIDNIKTHRCHLRGELKKQQTGYMLGTVQNVNKRPKLLELPVV